MSEEKLGKCTRCDYDLDLNEEDVGSRKCDDGTYLCEFCADKYPNYNEDADDSYDDVDL